jgi:hypothetical protein
MHSAHEAKIRFSARLDPIQALSVQPAGPVVQVRDVVICTASDAEVSSDESRAHPSIASPVQPFFGEQESPPVDLGRGLRIDRLPESEENLVLNACTPRGHYFAPIRQFGQMYSFVRNIDLDAWKSTPFHWDRDGVLSDAVMLSRLVRDNSYSTALAARIADFADGEQTVVYTIGAESKVAYRLRRNRDWLDANDGAELRDLLRAYWSIEGELPRRVERAIWRTEYASWLKWGDLVIPTLVSGLEALLKTERGKATHQFVTRVPALAVDVGIGGITPELCSQMYDARSEWVHGAHVRLVATGLEHQLAEQHGVDEGPTDAVQRDAFAVICQVQDVLRRAVRLCIEDADFRAVFSDDEAIRARWPVNRRA